ncbi:HD-GYP domain-containing protein (c-di-GMP phosphodiesterase class II) [Tumebacillus sp. BK434]|nr:HD-GYP domain-containing protein (c-di-GMP phosphodiesterase class II) [Tumebacillus sp. BK434]
MKMLSLHELSEAHKIARPIYAPDQSILLNRGASVKLAYKQRLEAYGILSVYVEDEFLGTIEDIDPVSDVVRQGATRIVQLAFDLAAAKKPLNIDELIRVANQITDDLLANRGCMVQFTDIRSSAAYRYAHSVNVCILATLTAIGLGYDMLRVKQVAIGSLLHDIGYALTDNPLDHPMEGFNLLRRYPMLHTLSAAVAVQHHERIDGSGFPRSLKGDAVHEYAQICALADMYDHLTNAEDGTHVLPHYALEKIMSEYTGYDQKIITAFVRNIAPYPVGTSVRLNDGQEGKVIAVPKGLPLRPVVKLFATSELIHLLDHSTLFVTEVIEKVPVAK